MYLYKFALIYPHFLLLLLLLLILQHHHHHLFLLLLLFILLLHFLLLLSFFCLYSFPLLCLSFFLLSCFLISFTQFFIIEYMYKYIFLSSSSFSSYRPPSSSFFLSFLSFSYLIFHFNIHSALHRRKHVHIYTIYSRLSEMRELEKPNISYTTSSVVYHIVSKLL